MAEEKKDAAFLRAKVIAVALQASEEPANNSLQQLTGLQRAEFARAARWHRALLVCQAAVAGLAAVTVYLREGTATYIFAVITVMVAIAYTAVNWRYGTTRWNAERARRATLLAGGLGVQIPEAEFRDMMARFSATREQGRKLEDPNYYAAKGEPGPKRLSEMLEESAFWSADMFRISAGISWVALAVLLALLLAALFAALPFVPAQSWMTAVRVVCAMLVLLVSKDLLGSAQDYSKTAAALSPLIARIQANRAAGFPLDDLLFILTDYNSAVERAPMALPRIYAWRKDRLNELWARRYK